MTQEENLIAEANEREEVLLDPKKDLTTLSSTFKTSLEDFYDAVFKKIDAVKKDEEERKQMKYRMLLHGKDLSISFFEVLQKAEKDLFKVKPKIYSKKKHKK